MIKAILKVSQVVRASGKARALLSGVLLLLKLLRPHRMHQANLHAATHPKSSKFSLLQAI